jgi:hypothetical protein
VAASGPGHKNSLFKACCPNGVKNCSKIPSRPFQGRKTLSPLLPPLPLPCLVRTLRSGKLFALGRSEKALGLRAVCSRAPNYMNSKCAEPSTNRRLVERQCNSLQLSQVVQIHNIKISECREMGVPSRWSPRMRPHLKDICVSGWLAGWLVGWLALPGWLDDAGQLAGWRWLAGWLWPGKLSNTRRIKGFFLLTIKSLDPESVSCVVSGLAFNEPLTASYYMFLCFLYVCFYMFSKNFLI